MVSLHKVQKEEATILHNLMQFYFYEFSKYLPNMKLGVNGAYKKIELDHYWRDQHQAYFIKLGDELIGFALVEMGSLSSSNTIQEFFIMAKYQGNGYGNESAKKLFAMFPGEWEVTQIEKNTPARAFWKGLIKEVTANQYKEYHENGSYVQKFNV
ncbi:GNAT family N-acetyltransferase [Pseudalkalibacillus hwajinpoensis]|uniref:GNAT family N-acetyltransferase n=1 Tax=Guptibacillus hwajinpoensis TaxID=208199 RepID=UPI001CD4F0E7|nr:GNAT family N-acetyltransferase [Pseudalkalibacillus hwajinpoensis]MCA0993460.1 GNAT family N-acetyltransferase [Pseudalkalibacillus hwajinpoensis]